jgi:hypothetical protein
MEKIIITHQPDRYENIFNVYQFNNYQFISFDVYQLNIYEFISLPSGSVRVKQKLCLDFRSVTSGSEGEAITVRLP